VNRGLDEIIAQVGALRRALADAEVYWADRIAQVDPHNRASAVNLVHYWAVRRFDLRALQQRLAGYGLSSMGRSEAHVQQTLAAITAAATALSRGTTAVTRPDGFSAGSRTLRQRTRELLGPRPSHRHTRIMVTLPSEAASDGQLIADLIARGMNVARINCAHDDPATWAAMVGKIRRTESPCRIAMDLAGPKLRTGPLAEGPRVVRLHPARDALGQVTEAAWCRLAAPPFQGPARDRIPIVPVDSEWLRRLRPQSTVTLRDTRDAKRMFMVVQVDAHSALACTSRTTYLATGTELTAADGAVTRVGLLPPAEQFLTLFSGDTVILTRDCTPAPVLPDGTPRIGCTLPEVFGQVRPGQPILFDDGKIAGTVQDCDESAITVKIVSAAEHGSKLRAGKGINLPETIMPVAALTDADRATLPFISEHADLVEMSFVRTADDVEDLLTALDELGDSRLGVVVKIETAQAFRNLPAILLAAMRRQHTGVMIARGDLAVECGYERLAELQEEILWLCEAGRLPVVWATEVLDRLARSGRPSRAEITDAAMGARAECVMLNKGPRIVDAVAALDDILRRMSTHADKQTTLMRSLRSWYAPAAPRK
jgi:pyruvate kinase